MKKVFGDYLSSFTMLKILGSVSILFTPLKTATDSTILKMIQNEKGLFRMFFLLWFFGSTMPKEIFKHKMPTNTFLCNSFF